ncbi:MAG: aldose 1-epimerase family protein [Clostridia bacterium]|nr:aldose 1-epimerase family protein [Clostridia bacterium]
MPVIEIKNDKLTVGINTLGSELMYINGEKGTEFLWNGDEKVWTHRAPVLFPICGGLKKDTYNFDGNSFMMKKLGFAEDSEFSGELITDTKAEFVLISNEVTKSVYPFDFKLTIVFELIENKLKVSNVVENLSDGDMFFSIGAHEGYSCPEGIEEYEIQFDDEQTLDSFILTGNLLENDSIKIIENSKKLPLKYEYFEVDALVFKNIKFNKVALAYKDGKKKVAVEFDQAKYFLLWTKPNANYICLEPWCGVQDIVGSDYNLENKEGIIKLEKNKSYSFTHTIECFE